MSKKIEIQESFSIAKKLLSKIDYVAEIWKFIAEKENDFKYCALQSIGINPNWDFVKMPNCYYDDNLYSRDYFQIRKEFNYPFDEKLGPYAESEICQDKVPDFDLLGLYSPDNDQIFLDLNRIRTASNNSFWEYEELKRAVLYHELGHRLSRFGSSRYYWEQGKDNLYYANNSNFFKNRFYQELIAQLFTYHCLNKNERKKLIEYAAKLPEEYQSFNLLPFENFKQNPGSLLRLILSITEQDINTINSIDTLVQVVLKIELKSNQHIYNEFFQLENPNLDFSDLDLTDL